MDYRSMVNPTFVTAKSTLYMLAAAGNEDAKKVIEALGTQDVMSADSKKNEGEKSPMSEADSNAFLAGVTLAVEARYAALSHYISANGVKNLLDIACGYTPRSVYCSKNGVDYVGVDVPVVAEELQKFATEAGIVKDHPVYVGGDATNEASLKAAADHLDGEILISCEGLTGYLSADEADQFFNGIRELLKEHGGAWVTSDFGVDYEAFATVNMTSPDAVKIYRESKNKSMKAFNVYNDGVSYWDEDKITAFINDHGLLVEKLPFYYEGEDLNVLSPLPEPWKDNFMNLLKSSTVWKMTVDPAFKGETAVEGATEVDNLKIDYVKCGGVLECKIKGRIDTISSPALLEVFDKNYDGIKRIVIDGTELQYVSSAGLRVMLMAVKRLGDGSVSIDNASDEVKEIFDTTGFSELIILN